MMEKRQSTAIERLLGSSWSGGSNCRASPKKHLQLCSEKITLREHDNATWTSSGRKTEQVFTVSERGFLIQSGPE